MNTLAKIILFSSPVLFFVLYFVISNQRALDLQMQKEDSRFERSWAEQEAEIAKDPQKKKMHEDRAKAAEMEIEELKKKEKERELKDAQFEKAMEDALRESEKELKERLKK